MTTLSEGTIKDRGRDAAQDMRELTEDEAEAVAGGSGYINSSNRSGYISASD